MKKNKMDDPVQESGNKGRLITLASANPHLKMLPVVLDKNSRIVIPKEIRQELDLKPGQLLGIETNNGEIIIRKAELVVKKQ